MNGTFLGGSSSSLSSDDDNDVDETHFLRVVVVEGETKNISVNAEGNPPQIQYSWSFPEMAATGSQDFRRRVQVCLLFIISCIRIQWFPNFSGARNTKVLR